MASYRSSEAATVESGTSVTVTKPSGLAEGDLMVAFCCEGNSGGNFSTPSGWTSIDSYDASFDQRVVVFAKKADSSDAAASNFTFSYGGTSNKLEVVLYAISGTFAGTGNIYAINALGGTEAVSDTFRCATGITPSSASSLLIMFFYIVCGDSDSNSISNYAIENSNPTWTERHDIQDAGGTNSKRIGTATATRTETTDTGYFQAEVGAGGITESGCIGVILAIQDTENGTHNATVIDSTLAIQAPTVSGGSQANPSVIDATLAVQAPTTATAESKWKNTDKSSAPSWVNTDKS